MGTNTIAGTGLVFSRNANANAPTFQANRYTIKNGYSTKIGLGDVVATGTGGNLGYVILAADGATSILGVFAGVEPYYDTNLQTSVFIQWWTGTSTLPSGVDAPCFVIDDQTVTFRAQAINATFAQSWRGKNIDWISGNSTNGNGAPNISGISVLCLNGAGVATTNTFPFRIMQAVGVTGGPQDPANANPWIEVTINPGSAERLQSTGI